VIPYLKELAGKIQTEVVLIRVVERGRHVHSGIGGLTFVRFKDIDIDAEKVKAQKYIEGIGAKLAGTKAKVSYK